MDICWPTGLMIFGVLGVFQIAYKPMTSDDAYTGDWWQYLFNVLGCGVWGCVLGYYAFGPAAMAIPAVAFALLAFLLLRYGPPG